MNPLCTDCFDEEPDPALSQKYGYPICESCHEENAQSAEYYEDFDDDDFDDDILYVDGKPVVETSTTTEHKIIDGYQAKVTDDLNMHAAEGWAVHTFTVDRMRCYVLLTREVTAPVGPNPNADTHSAFKEN